MASEYQERFLHFIWKYKLFNPEGLKTADNQPIVVEHPGIHNHNSGPDFTNARIRIGATLWFGPVEIHLKSSDYLKHRHETDPAYDAIILHVVGIHDTPVAALELRQIPTLEIERSIFQFVQKDWEKLLVQDKKIPCGNSLGQLDNHQKILLLQEKGISRLIRKSAWVNTALESSGFDWEETFHRIQARAFGMQVNDNTFEWLARETPLKLISRLLHNPELVKHLVRGQAGFLSEHQINDAYALKEYTYLKETHQLHPLPLHAWKHSRMRPAGFPENRVLQWIEFIIRYPRFLSKLAETEPDALFEEIMEHAEELRRLSVNFPSTDLIRNLAINAWSVMLFQIGNIRNKEILKEYALRWLELFKAEDNTIIRQYRQLGLAAANALESQGLLELFKESCTRKACLDCKVFTNLTISKTKLPA